MSSTNLKEFLAVGSIVRTKLTDTSNWITNVVYSIHEEFIEIDIGLEKNYVENLIMVGDTIKCKYTAEDYEYIIIGWVSRVKAEYPQSITVHVHQIEKFENKRDSYRYDVYLSSVVKINRRDTKGVFTILTSISNTGAAFAVREDIEKLLRLEADMQGNLTAYVEIYISPDIIIQFEGQLVRKSTKGKGVEYGVKVMDMDLENEILFRDFLRELANKDKEFYNKRSGFWSRNSGLKED